jgi:4-amino-4-deoxy-L-arabinose transferase-like glycosyltransferase
MNIFVKNISMLQRIQTVYLLLVIISLIVITTGSNIVKLQNTGNDHYSLALNVNVFGIQADADFNENITDEELEKISSFLDLENKTNRVKSLPILSFPFYLISIFILLLAVACLLSFKKLKTQQKLGRLTFLLNLLSLIFIIIIFYGLRSQMKEAVAPLEVGSNLGIGFFCFITATAFSFLANIGIKRDVNLIDSIDRIR